MPILYKGRNEWREKKLDNEWSTLRRDNANRTERNVKSAMDLSCLATVDFLARRVLEVANAIDDAIRIGMPSVG